MEDSVFTKIIKGEIPSYRMYEDEYTFAFLDIYPIQPGQLVIVPKNPVAYVWDMTEQDYNALMNTTHRLSGALKRAFPAAKRIGMQIEGLDIDHAHVKLFPFNTDKQFHNQPDRSQPVDHDTLQAVAQKILKEVER